MDGLRAPRHIECVLPASYLHKPYPRCQHDGRSPWDAHGKPRDHMWLSVDIHLHAAASLWERQSSTRILEPCPVERKTKG